MAKTLVGVNILTAVDSYVYSNHCAFWKNTQKLYPEDQFVFFTPRRMSIDNMRNEAAKGALENECDYLMFIDDDVIIDIDSYGILKRTLEEQKADIVAGLTYIRSYPFAPMFFKKIIQDGSLVGLNHYWEFEKDVQEDGTVDCYAIGTSLALIRTSCYRDINPPYFVTGTNHTEDVYFCAEVKREKPESKFLVQTKCPTGHLLEPMVVSIDSVKKLRDFYRPEGETEDDTARCENSIEYVKKCLEALKLENPLEQLELTRTDKISAKVPLNSI